LGNHYKQEFALCYGQLSCLSLCNIGVFVAEWFKMSLGTKVGLGPGHIVLDGDPAAPTEMGTAAPAHFLAHVYCGQMVAHLTNC